jgi:hypothetical protein
LNVFDLVAAFIPHRSSFRSRLPDQRASQSAGESCALVEQSSLVSYFHVSRIPKRGSVL